jgi:acetyl-CoA carboxylase biotin carboxyl carrier protein
MARARRSPRPPAEAAIGIAGAGGAVDLARQLAVLLRELDLTEIEASVGDVRVRLQRSAPPGAAAPAPAAAPAVVDVTGRDLVAIDAPMVGTFYRASAPTAEPYVKEGDVVKEGQILCIIEAMKLMNEIEARRSGRIAKILVDNGQPVEYGQPLFLIDPAG